MGFNSNLLLKSGLILLFSMTSLFLSAQISTTSITVKANSTEATSVSATDSDICNGESTDLSVVGGFWGTGADWQWYEDGCGTGSSIGSGPSITVSPANATTATITKTYYVRAEGDCNTIDCQSVTITILLLLILQFLQMLPIVWIQKSMLRLFQVLQQE
ncbi:MAG: hypothetical protein R2771_04190 [Saprospiraceae bacterium]